MKLNKSMQCETLPMAIQTMLKCSVKEIDNLNTCHQQQFLLQFLQYAKGWSIEQKGLKTQSLSVGCLRWH